MKESEVKGTTMTSFSGAYSYNGSFTLNLMFRKFIFSIVHLLEYVCKIHIKCMTLFTYLFNYHYILIISLEKFQPNTSKLHIWTIFTNS